jgi:hypothetical protein
VNPSCPFPGLRPFEAHDAPFFHGRDEAIDVLLERLESVRAVALLGPSGSGKSSLVRAGLLPAVADGVLGRAAKVAVVRPGWKPVGNLGHVLKDVGIHAPDEILRVSSFGIVNCAAAGRADPEPLLLIQQERQHWRLSARWQRPSVYKRRPIEK